MAGFHQSHMCLLGPVCLYDTFVAFALCRHFNDVGLRADDDDDDAMSSSCCGFRLEFSLNPA